VALGKMQKTSPILTAIQQAELGSTGEIRVHLSRRWFERDPLKRAIKLFQRFEMNQTPQKNAVLLYLNLRKRKFAVVGDLGIHEKVGQYFWEKLAADLAEDLQSTHSENAIAKAIHTIGEGLKKYFPSESA
jgi:uncharacterized membrane protein